MDGAKTNAKDKVKRQKASADIGLASIDGSAQNGILARSRRCCVLSLEKLDVNVRSKYPKPLSFYETLNGKWKVKGEEDEESCVLPIVPDLRRE